MAKPRKKKRQMYDPLWENHPKVKKIRAESKAEGEIKASQRILVNVVKVRFPALAEMAQQKATEVNSPDILNYLIEQITAESEEAVVRALLRPTAA